MIRITQFYDLHHTDRHVTEADHCFGYMIDCAIARRVNAMVTGSREAGCAVVTANCGLHGSFVSFSY